MIYTVLLIVGIILFVSQPAILITIAISALVAIVDPLLGLATFCVVVAILFSLPSKGHNNEF